MKRLSWSKPFTLAAAVSLGLASIASADVPARIPDVYSTGNPLATSTATGGAPAPRAEFEGPASGSDFLNYVTNPNANLVANPQIAVGPDDIVMIVNAEIFRVQNGNGPGNVASNLYPDYQAFGGGVNGAQKAGLDNWIGEIPLAQLCPTGNPRTIGGVSADVLDTRSAATCQIDNATTVYDQLHGRFLVLFTVVDTGLTFDPQSQGYHLTRPRKASWVLLVSRFALLADQACLQGTSPSSNTAGGTVVPCVASQISNPGTNPAGNFAFVTPVPPSGSNTGGVNTGLWTIYYGSDVATIAAAGDNFGSFVSATVANGLGAGANNQVGAGNINAIPGAPITSAGFSAPYANSSPTKFFSCAPGAVAASGTLPTTVCYLPTSARLGIDNDTVTIASAVINGNVASADSSLIYNPVTGANPIFSVPDYAGTRIRVLKKTAIYNWKAPLAIGSQFASGFDNRAAGDYYDLYSGPTGAVSGSNTAGDPIDPGVAFANGPLMVYTAVLNDNACVLNQNNNDILQPAFNLNRCTSLFYEPAHLRGRAMATFSNLPLPGSGSTNSVTYLEGAISSTQFRNLLYVQGVLEIYSAPISAPGTFGTFPFYPTLQTTTSLNVNGLGYPNAVSVDFFRNPGTVPQQTYRPTGAAPNLFIGDSRPHTVIFREGHLYDARVVDMTSNFVQNQFPAYSPLSTTTAYDINQKLFAGFSPSDVYQQHWQNSIAYAPMFDVPANVLIFGNGSPLFAFNYLEKLFVATTYPSLAGLPDTLFNNLPASYDAQSRTGGDPRSRETYGRSGILPTQLPAMANCYNYQQNPGAPVNGITNQPLAWASLFDIRCGQDATDSNPQIRDPRSGVVAGQYAYTIRGGSGLDPTDGSLWNFGAYAQKRDTSIGALAHWGTFAANYKLAFPTVDQYNNQYNLFLDTVGLPEAPFIQMATNLGFVPALPPGFTNPTVVPMPFNNVTCPNASYAAAGVTFTGTIPGCAPTAGNFGPNDYVTREEMAYWIIKAQMDEPAITAYLAATGGTFATFSDVPTTHPFWKYIEIMARRGYTSGCSAGTARRYCPDYISTRKDMAVFMIRAKMNNVFPSLLSGCALTFGPNPGVSPGGVSFFPGPATTNCAGGDTPAAFIPALAFFTDNPYPQSTPVPQANDEYPFLQIMRELRITSGVSLGAASDGRNGCYGRGNPGLPLPNDTNNGSFACQAGFQVPLGAGNLLRKQVATFIVRGFFF